MRTPSLLLPLLLLAACGGSNPKALTDDGYAALGKGDAKAALASFDEALTKLEASAPEYLRAALGRCDALARLDPPAAKRAFLDLASAQSKKVREDDYSLICASLLRAEGRTEAVEVMHAGNLAFPDSKKMADTKEAVINAAKKANDPEALSKLKGLGYAGD